MYRYLLAMIIALLPYAPALAHGMASDVNFIVFADSDATARSVLARANVYRDEVARDLLGNELPPGVGRTIVYVRQSQNEDTGRTWPVDSPTRRLQSVWVTSTAAGVEGALLKHEIAHVVLATRFPGRIPPWADEGLASRYDDPGRIAIRRRIVEWFSKSDNWPRLESVLQETTIAGGDEPAYAVASSLTAFLLTRSDRATFIAFASDGAEYGWDEAVRRHYGLPGTRPLENAWRTWVRDSQSPPRTSP